MIPSKALKFLILSIFGQVNDCARAFAKARADAAEGLRGSRRGDEGLPERDVLIGNFNQVNR
jgi:hypothetical protein